MDEALLVPARLDLNGRDAEVPPLLSGLVRRGRRVTGRGGAAGGLAARLAGLPAAEQERLSGRWCWRGWRRWCSGMPRPRSGPAGRGVP